MFLSSNFLFKQWIGHTATDLRYTRFTCLINDNPHGCFKLCNWFSLWYMVSWINQLLSVWWCILISRKPLTLPYSIHVLFTLLNDIVFFTMAHGLSWNGNCHTVACIFHHVFMMKNKCYRVTIFVPISSYHTRHKGAGLCYTSYTEKGHDLPPMRQS